MNPSLLELVAKKLTATPPDVQGVRRLVLASCHSAGVLQRALEESEFEPPTAASRQKGSDAPDVWLSSLVIKGFRGIGAPMKVDFEPTPGLTLVLGRNGSGKSSVAEGLETLLHGDCSRLKDKPAEWKKGWANVHWDGAVEIEAEFRLEGQSECAVATRRWESGDEIDSADLELRSLGSRGESAFPSRDLLDKYRPILSCGQLGRRLERRPADLYDELAGVLGLHELVDAQNALRTERVERKRRCEQLEDGRGALLETLSGSEDARVVTCREALLQQPWDLDAIGAVLEGRSDSTDELNRLRLGAELEIPSTQALDQARIELQTALVRQKAADASDAGEQRKLAKALREALALYEHMGEGPCSICESDGVWDEAWRSRAEARMRDADAAAAEAHKLAEEVRTLATTVGELSSFLGSEELALAQHLDVDPEHIQAIAAWLATQKQDGSPSRLAAELKDAAPSLLRAGAAVRAAAVKELNQREEGWRRVVDAVRQWLPRARAAVTADEAGAVERLVEAEDWLKTASSELRADRFAPIAQEALKLFQEMRENSNVSLREVSLAATGGRTRRRVQMRADVDGEGGTYPALSIMSQGELNVLALSLFLPRMMLAEAPCRFVVLDDPIQSMDPHKVDGLARVLGRIAERRQVIVFTHDPRLQEAIDRLGIAATYLQVTRLPSSAVEVRRTSSPVEKYLEEANRMLEPEVVRDVGDEKLRRIVPGICRLALEAALQRSARRRLHADGKPSEEADRILAKAKAAIALASLTLFARADRGSEVAAEFVERYGDCGRAYEDVNGGAHGNYDGALKQLVRNTRNLTRRLEEKS
ncbi:MAG: AAA family ATPase [Deltaproteobacteria bacterium]|nr:AAA family ATPase [Deltaproteobacteria bacterium]